MNQQRSQIEVYSFGAWLRRQRKARDWTQAALAQRVGCTAATIRKIEADERKPSQQLAGLLATVLGVPNEARAAFLQTARQLQPITRLSSISLTPVTLAPVSAAFHKPTHNLPAPMTSLVNRVQDTNNVAGLLARADVRLLTLLGPPGIGKTRLAIHSAEQVAAHFHDGICFVDLASLTDATLVLPTIAYLLAVAEAGAMPLLDRLCAMLAEKQLLLVLDNFEQVSAAAHEIGTLLRSCKGIKVLATSRTPLLLSGEHEYALPSLSLPPRDLAPDRLPDQLMAYEAVQLFVARVRQHQHDFVLTLANAHAISTICIRLDGLPLALELAAAALRRMSLSQLTALLHDGASWLRQLQSPARDRSPRQQTLYQAIAWSYSLLDPMQQMVMRQLGCFVGGFTAAAAQAVCDADPAMLDYLTEHNLLARRPGRWQLLEMIREFALVQMNSAERVLVQQRHTAYFAAQAELKLALTIEAIAQDHDNFRTALATAIDAQDAHTAFTLCINLVWFWELHGYLREGISRVRATLALPAEPHLRFDLMERMATLAFQVHQFDVAINFAEQITVLAQSHGDPVEMARALNLRGRIFIEQGEYTRAEAVLLENIALARRIPQRFNPGCPLAQLGELALARGDGEAAQRYLLEALPLLTGEENLYTGIHAAMAHTDMAELALVQHDPTQARQALQQALPYARHYLRRLHCLLVTLVGLMITSSPSATVPAAMLLGALAGLESRTGDTLSPFHQRLIAERMSHARQRLSQQQWDDAWQIGYGRTPVQLIDDAAQWLGMETPNQPAGSSNFPVG